MGVLTLIEKDHSIDYAIVGGGIAGAYCAWRLQSKHPYKKIVLFEFSNRIGGRLLTVKMPNKDHSKVELGGMRYSEIDHPIFAHLVGKLELHSERFPMGYTKMDEKKSESREHEPKDDSSGSNNYAYFRGQHLRISDFKDSTKVPYHVRWSERDLTPDALQSHVMKKLVPDAERLEDDDWFDVKVFGEYLWKYGFWNLLYRVLSPEAYLFLKYASGYDTNASNGNAVTLLPAVKDYKSDKQYMTVKEGMMAVPEKLCEEFLGLLGGELQLNHRLLSIVRRDDKKYILQFARTKTEEGKQENTIDTTEDPEVWATSNVILAMPKASLERIQWAPFQNDPWLKKNMDSVLIQPAVKIALEYEYPWWKALGIFRGRSISDLPLRQTYYFTDLDDLKLADPFEIRKDKHAVMIASYSDLDSVPFWEGLEEGDDYKDGPTIGYKATISMVKEAHRQVLEIHGQSELPSPCAAAYFNWDDSPFGGAWHCWKPGFRYNDIHKKMRHPINDENVYICGEAFSPKQGWAEGALQTAEELLCRDLDKPDRLDPLKERLDWVDIVYYKNPVTGLKTVRSLAELSALGVIDPKAAKRKRLVKLGPKVAERWTQEDSTHRVL